MNPAIERGNRELANLLHDCDVMTHDVPRNLEVAGIQLVPKSNHLFTNEAFEFPTRPGTRAQKKSEIKIGK